MIQANELRIGDWVNEEVLGNVRVSAVLSDTVAVLAKSMKVDRTIEDKEFSMNLSNINPIPLTPEILERAGFVKTEHKLPLLTYYDYRLGNCVASVIPSGIEIEFCGLDIEERTYITKVNHIHQLQNLYFALTGTELTIKL